MANKRLQNVISAEILLHGITDYEYGIAREINEEQFEFSKNALCNNWNTKQYDDVVSYQSLDPVKCITEGKYYPYFKFQFK